MKITGIIAFIHDYGISIAIAFSKLHLFVQKQQNRISWKSILESVQLHIQVVYKTRLWDLNFGFPNHWKSHFEKFFCTNYAAADFLCNTADSLVMRHLFCRAFRINFHRLANVIWQWEFLLRFVTKRFKLQGFFYDGYPGNPAQLHNSITQF